MRLGSIMIGGVERISRTLLRDFEIVRESGDRMGTVRLLVLYQPTDTDIIQPGDVVEIFRSAEASVSGAAGLYGATLFGETLFGEAGTGEMEFSGNVVNVEPTMLIPRRTVAGESVIWGEPEFGGPLFGDAPGVEGINIMRIECRDQNYKIESATIDTGVTYTSKTDKFIIEAVLGTYLPEIDTSNVASTVTLSTFEAPEGETVRVFLQKLQEKTGVVYKLDAELRLHWFLPTSRPAPFGLSEEPDFLATYPFERQSLRYSMEWRNPGNSIRVKGAVGSGGVRFTGSASDAPSIAQYGTRAVTIVDPQIKSNSEATARAAVVLAERKLPQVGGICVTYVDGLDVGEFLNLTATQTLNLDGDYTIRRIMMRWLNPTTTRYELEWGAYQPDAARAIRALYDASRTPAEVLPGTPAPGTVDNGAIIPGSVTGGSGGSLASATITQANMGSASIGTAQIIDANITEAKIGDAQISNAKIISLSATKVNADDLEVGGSGGRVGQVKILDGSNAIRIWLGKNGSDYGLWGDAIWLGGTGPGNARLTASGGNLDINMAGGDAITIGPVGNYLLTIDQNGIKGEDTVTSAEIFIQTSSAISITSGSGSKAVVIAADNTLGGYIQLGTIASSCTVLSGSGTPEGAVAANVGSIFLRSNGGAGTSLYVKESGSGNTGWVAK